MKGAEKFDIYNQYHLSKRCRVCLIDDQHLYQFIFCQTCDDGYHLKCLNPPLTLSEAQKIEIWKCPECCENQRCPPPTTYPPEQVCYECQVKFLEHANHSIEAMKIDRQGNRQNVKLKAKVSDLSVKVCRFCHHHFHARDCFSPRYNSLNCWECQRKIRFKCPKNHLAYLQFLKQSAQERKRLNLIEPFPLKLKAHTKLQKQGLQVFRGFSNWESICRSQASLYYALRTNNAYYCQGQLYGSQQVLKLCQFVFNLTPTSQLHPFDQLVFEQFLAKSGKELPPLQIKEDNNKGFYVVATQFIPQKTILSEYAGEVCTRRQANQKHYNNDSVMSLLVSDFASTSLDIIPVKFCNFSRFILGIPAKKVSLKNVETLNFCYKGRPRIIFYASSKIERGQTLYIDYNSGLFEQYPTDRFN